MALTQISTNGIKNGTITGTDLATNIDLVDNQKVRFGTGNDLQIWHDGSHSFIRDIGTGALQLSGNRITMRNGDAASEYMFTADENGAVELYYDNSKKFETTSSGVTISGITTTTNSFRGNDNVRLGLGTGNDLEIYHDGTHSYINNTTGDLRITDTGGGGLIIGSDDLNLRNSARNENYITCAANGGVELYYDNSKKLETVTGGVYVYGDLLFGVGTTGHLYGGDNDKIILGSGSDFQIYHNGTKSIIDNNTGDLSIETTANEVHSVQSEFQVKVKGGDEDGLKVITDGAVELYYDNALRLDTMIEGAKVKRHGGGSTTLYVEGAEGSSAILALYADDGDDNADKYRIVASSGGGLYFSNYIDGAWETNIKFTETTGGVELYYNNSKKFETTSYGNLSAAQVRVASSNASTVAFSVGDAGTGFYNSGSNAIGYSANGTQKWNIGSGGHITLLDDTQLRLGTDNDLQIYHNSSANTNEFTSPLSTNFRGKNLYFYVGANVSSEQAIMAYANQGVELYYDNVKKFETTTNGTDLRGTLHRCEGHFRPYNNNTWDLGTSGDRWRNIYTNDLNLSNEGGANDVDGTWGSYTIQEGAEDLFLINKRNGKKYKFNLTEVS